MRDRSLNMYRPTCALSVLIDKPNINICTHLSELGKDFNVVKHAVL